MNTGFTVTGKLFQTNCPTSPVRSQTFGKNLMTMSGADATLNPWNSTFHTMYVALLTRFYTILMKQSKEESILTQR